MKSLIQQTPQREMKKREDQNVMNWLNNFNKKDQTERQMQELKEEK